MRTSAVPVRGGLRSPGDPSRVVRRQRDCVAAQGQTHGAVGDPPRWLGVAEVGRQSTGHVLGESHIARVLA